jgi:glycosyltransferase involved in cell wall biosynthesis
MPDRAITVGIDARCLNATRLGAVGKSIYELVNRTAASGALHWHLLTERSDQAMWVPPQDQVEVSALDGPADRLLGWEQWSLPAAARRIGVDVLHAPQTTMPWWQPVPTVVTIHDTELWRTENPSSSEPEFYRDRMLPSAYQRARAVMTVSNAARRNLLARWPALKAKLYVVSPGVHERYLDAEPDRAPIDIRGRTVIEPYLLYIGGTDLHQRLTWALQTWWSCQSPELYLVACGIDPAQHDLVRRMVPRQFHERLILAPFVPESEMPRLYMRAAAVLYPSISGGFGLPVIEANAVGTPVLFSDIGSLSELKGPSAVVLPVDDLESWVRATGLIVQSRPGSRGPDRIARTWAAQYSWDSYVKRTLAVYEAVHLQELRSRRHETPSRAT